ncbi:M20 metallopeptidase family protein [Kineosporia succinea]|uniref:Hippurate hydrolase n=1 Tax=Kineosporia succinea TaxID=84632 RepID=A0ABT9P9B2_9ACTN|nr:amidohydrolase [Kineosporia succinea]MDP9829286.1 hippurate hydrolase [Kineosporia succinea]
MNVPEAPAEILDLYRDLHAHPELSGREHRTQATVRAALEPTAARIRDCGGTGLEAVLRNGEGPTVAFRADLDALPLHENTGLPYASTVPGVMHACGHDVHTAALTGAMRWLDRHRDTWRGTLVGVFQPAEETGAGALAMLDDGLFEATGKPDVMLGQHVTSAPLGRLLVRPGWFLSAQRSWRITVTGTGGHASRPHLARDPLVTAVAMVSRLQSVVSREIDPFRMAVLTVATFHAGTKENVIPAEAVFTVSARAYEPEVAEHLRTAMLRIVHGEAAAGGVDARVEEISHLPAVWNDPAENARAARALAAVFGDAAARAPGRSAARQRRLQPLRRAPGRPRGDLELRGARPGPARRAPQPRRPFRPASHRSGRRGPGGGAGGAPGTAEGHLGYRIPSGFLRDPCATSKTSTTKHH